METLARRLIVASSGLHMLAYLYAQSEHVVDASWPAHARFHALQALIWIEALDLANILVALRRSARWRSWFLLVCGAMTHGAYFVGLVALPAGSPPEGLEAHLPLAGLALTYGVGVALAFRSQDAADAAEPPPRGVSP